MGKIRPTKDWQTVADVLWRVWDPIGVNDEVDAVGEYDSYAEDVLRLLINKVDRQDLILHLRQIEAEAMGLGGGQTAEVAADVLLALSLEGSSSAAGFNKT